MKELRFKRRFSKSFGNKAAVITVPRAIAQLWEQFESVELIFDGNKVVAAEGHFTMIGVTKPLRVTVNGFRCGSNPVNKKPMCAGDVTATVKRSDFGLTKYIPAVSDEVKISVPVEAYKN